MLRSSRRLLTVLAVLVLTAAACGRDDGTATGGPAPTAPATTAGGSVTTGGGTTTAAPDQAPGLADGGFGDLGVVCSPGDGDPAPIEGVPGIDGTTIHVGTIADPGFTGRPGLNQEMFDTSQAVVEWCNEHGGVRGYQIELTLRDAALTDYQQRIVEACAEDFALVGGGAVFDDTGQVDRLACGLPDVAGFLVSPTAADADLTLSSAPNPLDQYNVAEFVWAAEQFPEATSKVGVLTGAVPSTQIVRDRHLEAMRTLRWDVVYNAEYNPLGESSWKPFAQAMADAGVELMVYIGEPQNFAALQKAAADIDFAPTAWLPGPNHYDQAYITTARNVAKDTYTRTGFFPFERAEVNLATSQYLELMETYLPNGKYPALLGAQSLSSWMLFLTSVGRCVDAGSLDRDCVYETGGQQQPWTGGGLHIPVDPTGEEASDCALILAASPEGWSVAEGLEVDEHGYVCDPAFVVTQTGDYGTGARCPSGRQDPLPSECA